MKSSILVVGAVFSGSIITRELADSGCRVTIINKRPHIERMPTTPWMHTLYSFIPTVRIFFHTNSDKVFQWLSRFTEWCHYEHMVLAQVDRDLLSIPINPCTINRLNGLNLDEAGVGAYLNKIRIPKDSVKTSEIVVLILNSVGADLYDKFFAIMSISNGAGLE